MSQIKVILGNCYTFNHNRSVELHTTRAGATYGLRVLLYSNLTDYLPTTEEAGVRIAVHEKGQVPFPDTLGYSAPTGLLSSFGLRLRRFTRLPAPYGLCRPDSLHRDRYIYRDFRYSVEGCHRSCFQWGLIHACGCGDPRFPTPSPFAPCPPADPRARACLDNGSAALHDCHCPLPCAEDVYSVAFSASQWPSDVAQVGDCPQLDDACRHRYRRNAGMLHIYYEQLNYESLLESEAYGFENLLADVGGISNLSIGGGVRSEF